MLALLLACAPPNAKAGLGPIEPSPIVQLVVAPPSATVDTGGVLNFSASAVHEDGTNSVPAVTWSATGGVITTDGVYTPGPAPGNFSVTASLVGGSLTRSAAVTVVAASSPVVSISVSPGSTSLFAGETQQFVVTGTRQDGSTLVPSVVWTATGGGISPSGLYSAGGAPGTYVVVATQQGGTLADTGVVTLSAPSGGPYPHRPSNYTTVVSDLDMSQAVPSGAPTERPVVGMPGWTVIYDGDGSGGSNWSRENDPTSPQSPGSVWRLHFAPGVWTTGHGVGNLGRPLPNLSEVYVSYWIKWDPTYEWHPISNKHLRFATPNVGTIIQSRLSSTWMRGEDLGLGIAYVPQNNTELTRGVWHHIEVLLKQGNPGTVKLWVDGQLRTNYTNMQVSGPLQTFSIDGHLGGGGMTKLLDSYYWLDHIFIAAP